MTEETLQGDFPGGVGLSTRADGLKAIYVDMVAGSGGEEHIGEVSGNICFADVTLVLDTSAYADGDVLAIAAEIPNFFREEGDKAILYSIDILDEDKAAQPFDILLFDSNINIGTINQPYDISDVEMRSKIGLVRVLADDYITWTNNCTATIKANDTGCKTGVMKAAASSRSLWIAAISRGTGTYTASGIKIKISALSQ